jgi:hypothetical protein
LSVFPRLAFLALVAGCAASTPPALIPWTAAPIAAPLPPGEPALPKGTSTALPPTPAGALPVAATPASGPLTFEAAAPDGRWLVTCQARADTNGDGRIEVGVTESGELTGDAMVRYLTFASGGEQAIDALLAASRDGRWLVFEREGRSELYDTETGARVDLSALGADTRREPPPTHEHRTLAFDDDRLFYVRSNGQAFEVLERRLSIASERTLFRGTDAIIRMELDAGGKKLALKVAGADSNKNGRSDFPHALERGKAPCLGPVQRFQVERPNADAQGNIVVDRASGEAVRVDDLAAIAGETLLRRDPEGALFADGKQGRRQLADKTCSGRSSGSTPAVGRSFWAARCRNVPDGSAWNFSARKAANHWRSTWRSSPSTNPRRNRRDSWRCTRAPTRCSSMSKRASCIA